MKKWYSQDLYFRVSDPQTKEWLQLQKFSRRKEESKPYIGLPSLGILHQEDELPEGLALKTRGAYIQKSVKDFKTETPLLRAYAKSYMLWLPSTEGFVSGPLADLGELPGEVGGNWDFLWEGDTGNSKFGELITLW